ncbi:hypothetical protein BO71DRAFT_139594 [Aspergillus ellipticus CBS 707.79]|uniref:Uncharacterized protein n=1 Tax=Aspergillus ellipticus CBS 707.79 TaxID=1448320 RepID=A0A319DKF9_9EURO|nr:hypothetical protein BO71DRAFT_139594 [Aspergillus ellipticus CBS 707.79]
MSLATCAVCGAWPTHSAPLHNKLVFATCFFKLSSASHVTPLLLCYTPHPDSSTTAFTQMEENQKSEYSSIIKGIKTRQGLYPSLGGC